jgi:L-histidine N-alpha-methyltransferase
MRLVSERRQSVDFGGATIDFDAGEHIVTEHSHKYDLEDFEAMAGEAGFRLSKHWSDDRDWFSVCFLEVVND